MMINGVKTTSFYDLSSISARFKPYFGGAQGLCYRKWRHRKSCDQNWKSRIRKYVLCMCTGSRAFFLL